MVEWRGDERVDPDLIAWNIWLVFVLVTVIVLVLVLA
jgi:fumarate reductase subunit C